MAACNLIAIYYQQLLLFVTTIKFLDPYISSMLYPLLFLPSNPLIPSTEIYSSRSLLPILKFTYETC